MEHYLTADDVAEALNCSQREAYEIMKELPRLRFRGLRRVSERALKDWIERNTEYPETRRLRAV